MFDYVQKMGLKEPHDEIFEMLKNAAIANNRFIKPSRNVSGNISDFMF